MVSLDLQANLQRTYAGLVEQLQVAKADEAAIGQRFATAQEVVRRLSAVLGEMRELMKLQGIGMPTRQDPSLPLLPADQEQAGNMTEAILGSVDESPGMKRKDLTDLIELLGLTNSEDPRKVISTRIGQLIKEGRIYEMADGGLWPAAKVHVSTGT